MRQRLFRIILSLAFSMMTVVTGMASEPGQGTETDKKVLTVGLFRYVPDIKPLKRLDCAMEEYRTRCDIALRRLGLLF